jgi:hypothetical protein
MKPKTIHIGNVEMPLSDFAISRSAILGITNSGKTYTAKGVAEQLLDHGVPIVVFDAIGVWRFLKVPGENARGKGYEIAVAGGRTPDLPLTPQSAPAIMHAAIKENIPLIIDLYDNKLSKADWRRIVKDCFRILLYNNVGVRHIFLEEAAEFAPQKIMDGDVYAEVEKLARMGGNASVGITFINQRAQELNKAVLELCDNVILMRQRGTHAIDSLEKWLDRLSPNEAEAIANSMPQMGQGDCWIFTEASDKAVRTRSGLIRSHHPDRKNPEQLAISSGVDATGFVSRLSTELTALIEEHQANDPAVLKRKIQQLEKDLKAKPGAVTETKEVPVLTDEERKRLVKLVKVFDNIDTRLAATTDKLEGIQLETRANRSEVMFFKSLLQEKLSAAPQRATATIATNRFLDRIIAPRSQLPLPQLAGNGESKVSGGIKRMMIALAQRGELTKRQMCVRAGCSSTSGTTGTYISSMRTNGWITQSGENYTLTREGEKALGSYTPLPEGQALYEYWRDYLGGGAARILTALFESHPNIVPKSMLGELAGMSHTSGTFGTYLSKLRTLDLIEDVDKGLKASDEFFQ